MLRSNNLITHQLRVVATRCRESTSPSVRRAFPLRPCYLRVVRAISRDLENATIVLYCLHTTHRDAVGRGGPQAGAPSNLYPRSGFSCFVLSLSLPYIYLTVH